MEIHASFERKFGSRRPWSGVRGMALGVLFFALISGARAEFILSNTSETSTALIGIGEGQYYAQKFTTGTSALGFLLDSIGLSRLVGLTDNPISLGIYADGGAHPDLNSGVLLTQISFGLWDTVIQYAPQTPLILEENTSYWITLSSPNELVTGAFYATSSDNYFAVPGWTYATTTQAYSSDFGTYWQTYDIALKVQIFATPIPEPSALILMTFSGVFVFRRRYPARA